MQKERDKHKVLKAPILLEKHKAEIIERLGVAAFDLLPPQKVAAELQVSTKTLPDLVRQDWLAAAPVEPIGTAKLYYRWRVEFVKQYRQTRNTP